MDARVLVAMLLALALTGHARGEEPTPNEMARVADTISPSLAIVEYTLRFDKGEPPKRIGTGAAVGSVFGLDERGGLVTEERPLELPGFVLSSNRVLTTDPMFHPRFVERILVRRGDQRVQAAPVAYLEEGNGLILELREPLRGARPLSFEASTAGPLFAARYSLRNGRWRLFVDRAPRMVLAEGGGRKSRLVAPFTLIVDRNGVAAGISLLAELPLDGSWRGSPLEKPAVSAKLMETKLRELEGVVAHGVMRAELSFRSPKSKTKGRFSFLRSEETETATELNVPGVLVGERMVLVLADLKPKVTARLERILLHPPRGDPVPADFRLSLEHFDGLLVQLRSPLGGELSLPEQDIEAYRGRLLLAAEIRVKGEERVSYLQPVRFTSLRVGWRRQLQPSVSGDTQNVFLFDLKGKLLALPLKRRQLFSEERPWRTFAQPRLRATAYLKKVLEDPERHADPNNVPLTEEEENRLAWMGVVLQALNKDLARVNQVSELTKDGKTGALVSYVYPGSPAQRVGVQPGYILLRLRAEGHPKPLEVNLDESPFSSLDLPVELPDALKELVGRGQQPWPSAENAFTRMLTDLGVGRKYVAEFFHEGKVLRKEFRVELGPVHHGSAPRFKSKALGLTVRDLTYEVRRHFQMAPREPGVIVSKVESGEKAAVAGIRPFETITHIDDEPVASVKAFEEEIGRGGERRLSLKYKTRTRIVKIVTAGPEKD